MTADIAISTYKHRGIARLAAGALPHIDNVRYIISWQNHDNAPVPQSLRERDDVTVVRCNRYGQSHNRNNALQHCTSDIIIISDDDLIYHPEGIKQLISAFEQTPEMELATFRSIHDPDIIFPDRETRLSLPLPKGYYVSCFEMAVRRNSPAGRLRFNPEFGLNSPRMHGGEDEMFLLSALRRGLDCRFLPVTVCTHPDVSTGLKGTLSPENLRSMGCTIAFYYRTGAIARIPLKAWRLYRAGQSPLLRALRFLTQGALAAPATYRRTRQYLW